MRRLVMLELQCIGFWQYFFKLKLAQSTASAAHNAALECSIYVNWLAKKRQAPERTLCLSHSLAILFARANRCAASVCLLLHKPYLWMRSHKSYYVQKYFLFWRSSQAAAAGNLCATLHGSSILQGPYAYILCVILPAHMWKCLDKHICVRIKLKDLHLFAAGALPGTRCHFKSLKVLPLHDPLAKAKG